MNYSIKNYSLTIFYDDVEINEKIKEYLFVISLNNLKTISGVGVTIFSFISDYGEDKLNEIMSRFTDKVDYILCELKKESFSFRKKNNEKEFYTDVNEFLKVDVIKENNNIYRTNVNTLLDECISESSLNINNINDILYEYKDLEKLNKNEISQKVDKLLDKGVNNLNQFERGVLDKLTNMM
jgi:hypothetical protein